MNHADRCDRCGAQAFVQVFFKTGDLLFCAHHNREFEIAYLPYATKVNDESERINSKPSISANAEA